MLCPYIHNNNNNINNQCIENIQASLDEATDTWGIKVERVEM